MGNKEKIISIEEYEKYKEATKRYQEFKRLREVLGKPVETTINPEKVKENLTSKEFLALVEEVRRKKH
ncbi:MAG: hypothetical protein ACUVUF_08435 [Candidatus Bathycorpusculaceae bacterium]